MPPNKRGPPKRAKNKMMKAKQARNMKRFKRFVETNGGDLNEADNLIVCKYSLIFHFLLLSFFFLIFQRIANSLFSYQCKFISPIYRVLLMLYLVMENLLYCLSSSKELNLIYIFKYLLTPYAQVKIPEYWQGGIVNLF